LSAMGCSSRNELVLNFHLMGINLDEVVRVETLIDVDPSDPRGFFADQPYRSVATGVGIEVADFNGTGRRQVRLTEDRTLGYKFTERFTYTLLPPAAEKPPPLDINARAMDASALIGSAPPLMAHFSDGGSIEIVIADQRCSGQFCRASEACCDGTCQDVTGDLNNCGACGAACGASGDSCSQGSCHCVGGSACPSGQSCCNPSGCVDFSTNRFHCGACDQACNPGETCQGGQCHCGTNPSCGPGGLCCSDGSCSTTGSCPCGAGQCTSPTECCDSATMFCADLSSADQNCGSCGTKCADPLHCVDGACSCQGTACVSGDSCCSSGCRNLSNDPDNCGSCGDSCGNGLACTDGQCACGNSTCAPGNICCNGTCVDPNVSPTHCGSCDISCTTGEVCNQGLCDCNGQNCLGNQTCCPDGCFDLQSSPIHCGTSCNAPGCPDGFACMNGQCTQTSCIPACDNGNSCSGTSCVCEKAAACVTPNTCCSGACVDLSSNHDNCMSCMHRCADNEQCVGGLCKKVLGVSCSLASECVSNFCVDGVCCGSACTGACTSCNLLGNAGRCSAVTSGTDPHHVCLVTPPSSCGQNGQCSSLGTCAYWPRTTPCGLMPTTCNGDLLIDGCDGNGGCGKIDCRPYACVPGTNMANATCTSGPCTTYVGPTTSCATPYGCSLQSGCFCFAPGGDCSASYCTGCP
jgi:hypothetical protein